MPEGAFQTDRLIFENKIWKNVLKFRLFFFIYGNAVFSESGVDIDDIHLNRGQFLRSYRNLQSDLEYVENHAVKQYSLSQVKRYVQELVQEKRIKLEVSQLGTLFTVVNYEQYQGFERFNNGSIEQRKNTERTDEEQMKNNNKNVKNDKNEKKDIYISAQHLTMNQIEYDKLVFEYSKELVDSKIDYARNYSKLKNYKSLYLTLNNWLKADKQKLPQQTKAEQKKTAIDLALEEATRINREAGIINDE